LAQALLLYFGDAGFGFTVQSKTQTPFRFATNPFRTKETREISGLCG
jgi:hypothetical protein